MSKTILSITLISLCLYTCNQSQTSQAKLTQLKKAIHSTNPIVRKETIKIARDKKLEKLVPELINTIYNNNYSDLERYLAARAYTDIYQARIYSTLTTLIASQDPILQNCAIEMLILAKKNNYLFIDKYYVGERVIQIISTTKSSYGIRIAARFLGLIKYRKALPVIMNLLSSRKAVYDEVITSIALLGHKDINKNIRNLLLSLISEVKDKRIMRSIKKAEYILLNGNRTKKIFEGRLMERLSDLSSDNFILSFEAENYFRLFRNGKDYLNNQVGRSETYDHKKIQDIERGRIPLLSFALRDRNAKIRFKAAKLLGDIGNDSCCKALINSYHSHRSDRAISQITLLSLARLNCPNILPLMEKDIADPVPGDALYHYLIKNHSRVRNNKKLVLKYPRLFSLRELFPGKTPLISLLINHPDNIVRLQAIYSLSHKNKSLRNRILSRRQKKEKDPKIQQLLTRLGYPKIKHQ